MIELSLDDFTRMTASKEPVPGGGGVSSLAGALAASLAEMVTNLTSGKKAYLQYEEELQDIMKKAEELRIELLDGIQGDADAFYPLSHAYSISKDDPQRDIILENCLKEAAKPPFLTAELCARVIELDEHLAEIGSKLSVSDAGTSAALAKGALYGAAMNVLVNTRLMKDREYAEDLDAKTNALLEEYGPRADACYEQVIRRLTNG